MKHVTGGNCWDGITSPQDEDVCTLHEEPRGECDECPRCAACDAAFLKAPKEPTVRMKTILPTMSKTDDFLACQWPYGRKVALEEGSSEAARYGSAFHEAIAARFLKTSGTAGSLKKIATKWGVDVTELAPHIAEAYPVLRAWLSGENPWKIDFCRGQFTSHYELSLAWDVVAQKARGCAPPDPATHTYPDRGPTEITGTADLICQPRTPRGPLLVLDHKTGYDVPEPEDSGQLLSLALAAAAMGGGGGPIILAFFHAPRRGAGSTIYATEVTRSRLSTHAAGLRRAWELVGTGALRPGPQCSYCPVFSECPVNTKALIELRGKRVELTEETVGKIHQGLQQYDQLAADLRARIRAWVKVNGVAVRPDGKELTLLKKPWTNLSQASIKRALGAEQGAKMLEKLEKLGCIEHTEREELHAVAPKGR